MIEADADRFAAMHEAARNHLFKVETEAPQDIVAMYEAQLAQPIPIDAQDVAKRLLLVYEKALRDNEGLSVADQVDSMRRINGIDEEINTVSRIREEERNK